MQRRTFLKSATYTGLGAWAASRRTLAADAEIELAVDKPDTTINPHIYGHFIEHFGGVSYDSIWAGHNSRIPSLDDLS